MAQIKLTDDQANLIISEACRAAAEVTKNYLEDIGGCQYPCGFAWVIIKPARGQLVKLMKKRGLGRVDETFGGFVVYNPSGNFSQNMDAKYEGAKAFVEMLKQHDVNAVAHQRID